jgi:hypothetical protein
MGGDTYGGLSQLGLVTPAKGDMAKMVWFLCTCICISRKDISLMTDPLVSIIKAIPPPGTATTETRT